MRALHGRGLVEGRSREGPVLAAALSFAGAYVTPAWRSTLRAPHSPSCRKTCRLNESFTNLESSMVGEGVAKGVWACGRVGGWRGLGRVCGQARRRRGAPGEGGRARGGGSRSWIAVVGCGAGYAPSPRSFTARWSGAWRCFFLSGSDMVLFVGWRLVGCVRKLLFSWRAVKNRAVAASEWGERLVVAERSHGAARAAARARSGGKVGPRAHALVSGMQVLESAVGLGRVVPSRDPTFRSARTRREPGPPLTSEASSGAFWERCQFSTGGARRLSARESWLCG